MNYRQYEELQLAIDGLRVHIQGTISRTYLVYTFRCDTTHDVLASLKQRVAPSDYARKLQLAAQYATLRKGPKSQNYEAWLQEWEKAYTECKALDLRRCLVIDQSKTSSTRSSLKH